jgi:hypothetical protein
MSKKIAIGGDHAGFEYKAEIVNYLQSKGYEVKDFGPYSTASCDYPDFAHPVASAVETKEFDLGILLWKCQRCGYYSQQHQNPCGFGLEYRSSQFSTFAQRCEYRLCTC